MGAKEESSPGRKEVKEVLRLFHEVCEELLKENRKAIMKKPNIRQFAAFILRDRHNWLNTIKILGSVPGVEVGDEFQFRAELCVIGLHQQFWKGIDYVEKDGIKLATSIVSSGRYPNFMNSSDVLTYSGEGGNPMVRNKWPLKDQVLKHGNLALKNNMERKTPVRVIFKICKSSKLSTYVYDGLYHVEKCWQERGKFAKLVFKFKLRRLSGQPKRTRGLIFRLDKYSFSSDGVLLSDSFENKKKEAVIVMNTLDYRDLCHMLIKLTLWFPISACQLVVIALMDAQILKIVHAKSRMGKLFLMIIMNVLLEERLTFLSVVLFANVMILASIGSVNVAFAFNFNCL
ncbi:hypothetical protein GH714_025661 [Hevea brasiliensis]|uniref:YDG domain-containing protein n=1 Tax=Hevea brasiliensis TaxID=3981 RepID=A0A6A6MHN8_HEVBR|nr:hypothetical protein GH714_025661 [Hevea brasiliensis]